MKVEIVSSQVSSTSLNTSLKGLSKWCGHNFVADGGALGLEVPEKYDGSEYRVTITVEIKQTKGPQK